LRPDEFIRSLSTVKENLPRKHEFHKFLDVGCGLGQKVYLASRMGFQAEGIELRPRYVRRANRLMKQFTDKRFIAGEVVPVIKTANAITFKEYDKYDVIYFYCPSPNPDVEKQIELAIAKRARVGAVVVGFLAQYFTKNLDNQKELKALGWEPTGNGYAWKRVSKPIDNPKKKIKV
jgi:SAM-dependent methyltransferase